jgi:hypothetical protein
MCVFVSSMIIIETVNAFPVKVSGEQNNDIPNAKIDGGFGCLKGHRCVCWLK